MIINQLFEAMRAVVRYVLMHSPEDSLISLDGSTNRKHQLLVISETSIRSDKLVCLVGQVLNTVLFSSHPDRGVRALSTSAQK